MAKPEKPAAAEGAATDAAAKPKNKKKLVFIIIGVLLLAGGGGAFWYFTKGSHHAEEAKVLPPLPPKFVALEPFTVNLQHEGGEQFLQIGLTLKFTQPELEEKIKLHMPEIRSRLLLLLSSKHAAELNPSEGKKRLAQEIIAETSTVLGLPVPPVSKPASVAPAVVAAPAAGAASEVEAAPAPAVEAAPAVHVVEKNSNAALDVLFTSFIIQ
jgi:flagellar FliL protein